MKEFDLKISVDEIPDAGTDVRGELPAEWLVESLLDPYTATTPLRVALEARLVGDTVHVEGDLSVRLAFVCSRTLAPGETEIRVRLSELYQPAGRHDVNLDDGLEADAIEDEPYQYQDKTIDLEPLIREELVLAQTPYPVIAGEAPRADDAPIWSSGGGETDPRWEKLKHLKLD